MKRITLVISLVAVASIVVFFGVWFLTPESKSPHQKETEVVLEADLPPPQEEPVTLTQEFEQEPVPKKMPQKKVKTTFYVLKIARCLSLDCVEDYKLMMQKRNLKTKVENQFQNTTFFEVISTKTFTKEHSLKWLNTVQRESEFDISRQEKNDQWQMTLGAFPSQKQAHAVMLQANAQLKGWLKFKTIETQKQILYHDIYSGRFQNRQKAISLQETLRRQHEKFFNIRVIKQTK